LLALIELNVPRLWEEGINFVLGLWTIVSPWVLGFAFHGFAMWSTDRGIRRLGARPGYELQELVA
jgi:hypothetical protein